VEGNKGLLQQLLAEEPMGTDESRKERKQAKHVMHFLDELKEFTEDDYAKLEEICKRKRRKPKDEDER
jgi:hypothetical protein